MSEIKVVIMDCRTCRLAKDNSGLKVNCLEHPERPKGGCYENGVYRHWRPMTMIDRLKDKEHIKPFKDLSPEEQACLQKANEKSAVVMCVDNEWRTGHWSFDCPNLKYCLKPDYQPEKPKELANLKSQKRKVVVLVLVVVRRGVVNIRTMFIVMLMDFISIQSRAVTVWTLFLRVVVHADLVVRIAAKCWSGR